MQKEKTGENIFSIHFTFKEAKGQFTLNEHMATNGNRHVCRVLSDQCVAPLPSVGVGWHLFLPVEHVELAFLRS